MFSPVNISGLMRLRHTTSMLVPVSLKMGIVDPLTSAMKVYDAAKVVSFPPQMRPILNRNFRLECKIQGFPVPRVYWLVDGIPVEEFSLNDTRFVVSDNADGLPDAVFHIRDVEWGDDHVVTCTAENADGADRTTTRLAVRGESC
ncbi:hypothetical protein JTE90_016633 [Oedothorax gibbosus]|uniref:Ig-like domain-containing protein n=1 Tax=Oedothorax gibbosus TaxID=931172 RepID=A0AAV6U476_9ARAC|nr:hypothetical protein JTE90_016633 [Oedothorax gibbosus]